MAAEKNYEVDHSTEKQTTKTTTICSGRGGRYRVAIQERKGQHQKPTIRRGSYWN